MIEAANEYIFLGYPVFPCAENDKTPLTKNGCKNATVDPDKVKKFWFDNPSANIGLECTGLIVIDVDGADNPYHQKFKDFACPKQQTPGGGTHYVMKRPFDRGYKNSVGKLAEHVDVRTNGGYIIVAPSQCNCKAYRWDTPLIKKTDLPDVPDWLKAELDALDEKTVTWDEVHEMQRMINTDNSTTARAMAYIASIPGETEGMRNDTAFRVAAKLRNDFALNEQDALDIFAEWNATNNPPLPEKEMLSVFKSAGRNAQKQKGCLLNSMPVDKQVDDDGFDFDNFLDRSRKASIKKPNKKDPLEPMPGIVKEIIDYLNRSSIKHQPDFAEAISIAFVGALLGRKVCDPMNCRTNLFFLGVLEAGEGKTQFQTPLNRLIMAAGCKQLLAPNRYTSDTALIRGLEHNGVLFWYPEEFGKELEKIKGSKNSPHLTGILDELLQFYSAAGGVYQGKAYAEKKFNIDPIPNPHLCLFGTTCPVSIENAFNYQSVTNGLLPRFILIRGNDNPEKNAHPDLITPPDEALVNVVNDLYTWKPASGNLVDVYGGSENPLPPPLIVPISGRAKMKFDIASDEEKKRANEDDIAGALWKRWSENARRLAVIYAVSSHGGIDGAEVDETAATWALRYACEAIERMAEMAHDHLADSYGDQVRNRLYRAIKRYGAKAKGGWVTRTVIARSLKMDKQELNRALESLQDQGRIEVGESAPKKCRPTQLFRVKI